MAIAVDHGTIGSFGADTAGSTVAFTTSSAVSSGGFIVLGITWFAASSETLSSVSGGGLAWTIDKQDTNNTNGTGVAIVSAQAPSGLATSTTITGTYSASVGGARGIAGSSFTGVATSSALDGTPPAVHADSGTGWVSNAYTLTAGSVLFVLAQEITSVYTSTTTGPATEANDFGINGFGATTAYNTAGSTTIAGTWSGTVTASPPQGASIAAAYKVAAGGGTAPFRPVVSRLQAVNTAASW